MKKSIVKSLSAFLVLVLILSVLPMAAFAAETEQHDHVDECCQNEVEVCAICDHVYMLTFDSRDVVYDAMYHKSYEVEVQTCALCGYTIRTETGNYQLNKHYVANWVLVSQKDGVSEYEGTCTYCHAELTMTY